MFRFFVLLVFLLAAESQVARIFYAPEDADQHFEEFIITFDKHYPTQEEKDIRFHIFKENLRRINEKNSERHAVFGITQFSDLTVDEYKRYYTGLKPEAYSDADGMCKPGSVQGKDPAPESLDWRKEGKVSEVKDQSSCGSCWAFSTVGNLEGQYAIKHDELIEFSEQQLVDCVKDNAGCHGGWPSLALTWLHKKGGAMTEKDYSYTAVNDTCKFDKTKAVLQVDSCQIYKDKTEDELKQILAEVGPLSICIDATPLQVYRGDVLECGPENEIIDHAVLLVGYGKEGDKPYWLIKNSWGPRWGEKGYFRLAMYKNSCLLLSNVVSAVVA